MLSRTLPAMALTLTALGLAPGAAHLMELPVKLAYPPAMYADVTSTLYVWFGVVGGSVQVAAALAVAMLAFRARGRPHGALLAVTTAALVVSLLLWALVVAPVNSVWADVAGTGEFVAAYEHRRSRWEFGHVAAFLAWFTGWLGLVGAVTRARGSASDEPME